MVCIAILGLARLVGLIALPLLGSTEGRYASIAADTANTGHWVVPRICVYGEWEPYWGKPPLAFWLPAWMVKLFGQSEFAVRLPSFVAGLALLLLVWLLARRLFGNPIAWLAVLVASSAVYFFAIWGLVTVDVLSSLCVTGIITSYALMTPSSPSLDDRTARSPVRSESRGSDGARKRRKWGYLFFAFLALGFLSKGPIVAILSLVPIAVHLTWTRQWRVLGSLPWLNGGIPAIAVVVAWFGAAETSSPGFLRHFFVREHFSRYFDAGFADPYGAAHSQLPGIGVVWWLILGVPWLFPLIAGGKQTIAAFRELKSRHRGLLVLMLSWSLWPLVFFAACRAALPTYLLPGLGGTAILIAFLLSELLRTNTGARRAGLATALPFVVVILVALAVSIWRANFGASVVAAAGLAVVLALVTVPCQPALAAIRAGTFGLLIALLVAWPAFRELRTVQSRFSTRAAVAYALASQSDSQRPILILRRWEQVMAFYGGDHVRFLPKLAGDEVRRVTTDCIQDTYLLRSEYVKELPPAVAAQLHAHGNVGIFTIFRDCGSPDG